jgi:hypothetical protein
MHSHNINNGFILITFFALLFAMATTVVSFVLKDNGDNDLDDEIKSSRLGFVAFGRPDEETGARLDQWTPGKQNPEELGSYYEGDILVPRERLGRNGIALTTYRWKNGQIPYVIKGPYTQSEKNQILKAFDEYHRVSCIRFIPKTDSHTDYISIQNGKTGCWSSVGRVGGKQVVNLQTPYCISSFGTVLHELYHAVGFEHEQSRDDRDDWVSIKWDAIPDDMEYNFQKAEPGSTTSFGVPYNYSSVMHYSAYAFSPSGYEKTIIPLKSGGDRMGQRDGFAVTDIEKLNKMYNCK